MRVPLSMALGAALLLSACGQTPTDRAMTGAGLGVAGGAVIGALAGAPMIGALVGGGAVWRRRGDRSVRNLSRPTVWK